MATAFPFDRHKFVRKLKSSGFNDQQAEALTEAVQESYVTAELATKADLREYESAIRSDLAKIETNLRYEMNDLRKDIQVLRKDMDNKYGSLRKDMDGLRKDIDVKIEMLRKDIILKLGSLMVVVVTFAPSVTKLLHLPA